MKNILKLFLLFIIASVLFTVFLGKVNAATPTVNIKGNGSDGPITIPYNGSVIFTWNLTSPATPNFVCEKNLPSGSIYNATSGSETVSNLTTSNTYWIRCFYSWEWFTFDSVVVNVLPQGTISVESVTINETSKILNVGETYQFTSTIIPGNATNKNVTWQSLEPSVASIDSSGKVTAVGPGYSLVRVTTQDGSKTAEANITVSSAPSSNPTVNIVANGVTALITVSPNMPINLTWTTTNVTYCHASGYWEGSKSINEGSETILGLTSTAIFVLTCEGPNNSVASSQVTVNVSPVSIPVISVTVNPLFVTISSVQGVLLVATLVPANATNKNVAWSSDAPNVASVNSATGAVMGVSAGTATITATALDGSGKSGRAVITVNGGTVSVVGVTVSPPWSTIGSTQGILLTAIINPNNATNKNVTWSSDNPAVATVNSNTGAVMGKSAGTATITATANDDSGSFGRAVITVNASTVGPSVDIKANGDDGPYYAYYGEKINISWTSNNATYCRGSGAQSWSEELSPTVLGKVLGKNDHKQITPFPSSTTETYTITCYDVSNGSSKSDSVTVNIKIMPDITITANGVADFIHPNGYVFAIGIPYGGSFRLTWNVVNATSCDASGGWSGALQKFSGSKLFTEVKKTEAYILTCRDKSGNVAFKRATVGVGDKPTTSSGGTGSTGSGGGTGSTGTGTGTGSTGSGSSGGTGSSGTGSSGSGTGSSGGSSGTGGSTGTGAVAMPTVDIKANNSNGPLAIIDNGSVTLKWTSANADSCTASNGWSGTKATSGSQVIKNIATSKTYTLACSKGSNISSDSVVVNTASSPWTAMIYPNGQEALTEGDTINLTWLANNLTNDRTMSISIKRFNLDGTSCGKKDIGTAPANQESFSWAVDPESGWHDIPDSCSGSFEYKIYIEALDSSGASLSAESADFFQIVPAPVVQEKSTVEKLLDGGMGVLTSVGQAIRDAASGVVSYVNDVIVSPIANLLGR